MQESPTDIKLLKLPEEKQAGLGIFKDGTGVFFPGEPIIHRDGEVFMRGNHLSGLIFNQVSLFLSYQS